MYKWRNIAFLSQLVFSKVVSDYVHNLKWRGGAVKEINVITRTSYLSVSKNKITEKNSNNSWTSHWNLLKFEVSGHRELCYLLKLKLFWLNNGEKNDKSFCRSVNTKFQNAVFQKFHFGFQFLWKFLLWKKKISFWWIS